MTKEEVARRASVGKPTLYKWWPTKAALALAMFQERIANEPAEVGATTLEEDLRRRLLRLIAALNGLFGKVMAALIAEGQSDAELLRELYERHIGRRRNQTGPSSSVVKQTATYGATPTLRL